MDNGMEHWTTGLSRTAGLALAGFLFMGSLALIGAHAGHARDLAGTSLTDMATTELAPDAIRRTAQLLDGPADRWPDIVSLSSPGPLEEAYGSAR